MKLDAYLRLVEQKAREAQAMIEAAPDQSLITLNLWRRSGKPPELKIEMKEL